MTTPADKLCATCGRRFSWRKKWADCWDEVRYCSQRCRRSRPGSRDDALEQAILALLAERPRGAAVFPEEAARMIAPTDWQRYREAARAAARRLSGRGLVRIVQNGRSVDASTARGAIEIVRPKS